MRHFLKSNPGPSRLVVFGAGLLVLSLGLAAGLRTSPLPAAPQKEGDGGLPADLRLVPKQTLAFASFNVKALLDTELVKAYEKELGPGGDAGKAFQHVPQLLFGNVPAPFQQTLTGFLGNVADVEQVSAYVTLKKNAEPPFDAALLLRTRDAIQPAKLLAQVGKTTRHTAGEHTYYQFEDRALNGLALAFVGERIAALGSREEILGLLDRKPEQPPALLREALSAAAGKTQLTAWIDFDNPIGAALKEGIFKDKDMPAEIKQFQSTRRAFVTASLDRTLALALTLDLAGEEAAKSAARTLRSNFSKFRDFIARAQQQASLEADSPVSRLVKHLISELKQTTFENDGTLVRMKMPFRLDQLSANWSEETIKGLLNGVEKVRLAARRAQSQNNLKQMVLAMHNYAGAYDKFPSPAILDKSGKALLSWRVAILPFIEEDTLYKQFKLDEPWDSEHNIQLLSKMPRVYAAPESKKEDQDAWILKGLTFYQVVVGPGAAFEEGKAMKLPASFPDGTSNTILVVEAGKPVPWTKPADVVFDPEKPLPKLGGLFEIGIHVALADGSVRFIPRAKPQGLIKEWVRRDSGKPRSAGLDE